MFVTLKDRDLLQRYYHFHIWFNITCKDSLPMNRTYYTLFYHFKIPPFVHFALLTEATCKSCLPDVHVSCSLPLRFEAASALYKF